MVAGSPVLGFVIVNAFFFEKKKYFTSRFLWMICAVVVTFWIVRNLPIEALEWLKAG
jgi:ABC-type long-subunit fatty acid transport system fused permease/ATPase subunit